jgi:hypothetical protein
MALTEDFLKSKGFIIENHSHSFHEWKSAVNGNIKLSKTRDEEWAIAIEHDHNHQEYFWLSKEQQIVDLLNALNDPII